jgi:hypothetical protein
VFVPFIDSVQVVFLAFGRRVNDLDAVVSDLREDTLDPERQFVRSVGDRFALVVVPHVDDDERHLRSLDKKARFELHASHRSCSLLRRSSMSTGATSCHSPSGFLGKSISGSSQETSHRIARAACGLCGIRGRVRSVANISKKVRSARFRMPPCSYATMPHARPRRRRPRPPRHRRDTHCASTARAMVDAVRRARRPATA